jgi:hypothetical protein
MGYGYDYERGYYPFPETESARKYGRLHRGEFFSGFFRSLLLVPWYILKYAFLFTVGFLFLGHIFLPKPPR